MHEGLISLTSFAFVSWLDCFSYANQSHVHCTNISLSSRFSSLPRLFVFFLNLYGQTSHLNFYHLDDHLGQQDLSSPSIGGLPALGDYPKPPVAS